MALKSAILSPTTSFFFSQQFPLLLLLLLIYSLTFACIINDHNNGNVSMGHVCYSKSLLNAV